VGIVLEEKMIFPLVKKQPVGIVQPALPGREVKLGAKCFEISILIPGRIIFYKILA
jgi:hypothetical protein